MADPLAYNLPLLRRLERAERLRYEQEEALEMARQRRLPVLHRHPTNAAVGLYCFHMAMGSSDPERCREWLSLAIWWLS